MIGLIEFSKKIPTNNGKLAIPINSTTEAKSVRTNIKKNFL